MYQRTPVWLHDLELRVPCGHVKAFFLTRLSGTTQVAGFEFLGGSVNGGSATQRGEGPTPDLYMQAISL